jgi:hypothetical protein
MKQVISALVLIMASSAAQASGDLCTQVSTNIPKIIEEWHGFIKRSPADKNLSVRAMYKDHQAGTLQDKLYKQCLSDMSQHEPDYKCLAESTDAFSAQNCTHPTMTVTNWQYAP